MSPDAPEAAANKPMIAILVSFLGAEQKKKDKKTRPDTRPYVARPKSKNITKASRRTDLRTDRSVEQGLLQRCEDASKNRGQGQ